MWITDSKTGIEQWNEIFNLSSQDILGGNRKILKSLSNFLEKPVDTLLITKASIKPNKNLYPMYLQARGLLKKPPNIERLKQVEMIFKDILNQQPDFSPAMAGLCKTYLIMYTELGVNRTDKFGDGFI